MPYLPTSRQKLSPLIEYYADIDDSDMSSYESSIKSPVDDDIINTRRIDFELDKKTTTDILKGIGIGIIFGIGVGICIGKKLFS